MTTSRRSLFQAWGAGAALLAAADVPPAHAAEPAAPADFGSASTAPTAS